MKTARVTDICEALREEMEDLEDCREQCMFPQEYNDRIEALLEACEPIK